MTGELLPLCLLGLLVATGCRAKEGEAQADAARVAATSTADATTDVTDEPLGFVLHRPGPGWKMVHREDAAALSRGAVAGALSPHDVVGLVHASRLEGDLGEHVQRLAARMPLTERQLVVGTKRKEDDHETLFFDLAGELSSVPVSYSGKAVARGEVVYDVVAWAPAQSGSAEAEAKAFLEAFELRGDAAVAATLPTIDSERGARVGDDFALRAGSYRDFALALRVDPPEGVTALVGAEAKAAHPQARLLLQHRERGLTALLTAHPKPEGEGKALHEQLVSGARETVAFEPGVAQASELGDAEALVTEGRASVQGEATRYRLASTVHGEHGLALWIWGPPDAMKNEAELVKRLGASVALEVALPAVEATTSAYSDHRLGFTLTTPSGWAREDLTPATLRETGSLVRWNDGGRWIAVLAVALPGAGSRHPWMVAFLEQLLRDQLGPVARATGERGEDELGGQAATRVSWHAPLQRVDALLIARDGIAYALLTVDHDATSYDIAKRAFALLP